MTQSLTLARPCTASFDYNGVTYDLQKFVDGDYINLQLTNGEIIKFIKGIGGNAAGAIDMQATISTASFRILNSDPFAEELLKLTNQYMQADSTDLKKMTLENVTFYFYHEEDGLLVKRTFAADFGSISITPNLRANANGDATQTVFAFSVKMPTGCRYKGREEL